MKFEDCRENYVKVATFYYLDNRSQDEIAEFFQISRYKVSRILKKCRLMRIVEFRVNNAPEYYDKLGKKLKFALNLDEAIVVPSGTTLQESKENVTRIAANYLENNIKDGFKIGLSWGSTIQLTLKYFRPHNPFPNAVFVQL